MAFNITLANEVTTKAQAEDRFKTYFNNIENFSNYNLKGGTCSKWVRYALEEMGLKYDTGIDAWKLFAELPYVKLIDLKNRVDNDKNEIQFGWSNDEMGKYTNINGSLIFGYSNGSSYLGSSIDVIQSINKPLTEKLKKYGGTKDLNITPKGVTPVTHVGLYYNKQMYNPVGKKGQPMEIQFNPHRSFQFVGYYPLLEEWKKKLT